MSKQTPKTAIFDIYLLDIYNANTKYEKNLASIRDAVMTASFGISKEF